MKVRAIISVVILMLTVDLASAQSTDPINFRTPFAFVVGDQLLPAGTYTVRVVSPTGTLSFHSDDGNISVLISSVPVQASQTADRFKFIFHRYGIHYYVSEIWTPGYKTGRTIQPRASELEVARNEKPQHVTLYADALGR